MMDFRTAKSQLRSRLHGALDLLYPPRCLVCETALPQPATKPLLCPECVSAHNNTEGSACRRCAMPVGQGLDNGECANCNRRRYFFREAVAIGVYREQLRETVINIKQPGHETLALSMGHLLAEALQSRLEQWKPDLVIPVPTHWSKRLMRGYYSPDLLVESIASTLSIPPANDALICRRRTRKQGMLSRKERRRNVRNAFGVCSQYDIVGTSVLLVDDVMTTGATANEASKVLRKAGVSAVWLAIVARGAGR